MKTKGGYRQGYNAQAVATPDQFVVGDQATDLAMEAPCATPMIDAAKQNPQGRRRAMPAAATGR